MGSTIEIESKNLEKLRLIVAQRIVQAVPFFGLFLFMLAAGTVYMYAAFFKEEVSLHVVVVAMWLFFTFVFGGLSYIYARDRLLRIEESGVRNLHPFRGLIRTPWCYVRYVDLGGLRCRLEDIRDDMELGTVHLGDYVCPTDVFDTMAVNIGFKDTDEGKNIYARVSSLVEPRPKYLQRFLVFGWVMYCSGLMVAVFSWWSTEYGGIDVEALAVFAGILLRFYIGNQVDQKYPWKCAEK